MLVHHPQHLHPQPLQPLLKPHVPHPRPGKRHHRNPHTPTIPHSIRSRLRNVIGAQNRQRTPQTMPGDCDAHFLVSINLQQSLHLRQNLFPRGELAVTATLFFIRVKF